MRNLHGVTVTSEAIASLCLNVMPLSARFLHAYFDYERNAFVCVFEDESFDVVPEGSRIPIDVVNQAQEVDGISTTAWHYFGPNGEPITGEEYANAVEISSHNT